VSRISLLAASSKHYGPSIGVLLLLVAAGLTGCGPDDRVHIRLDDDVARPPRSVIVFAPDGMDCRKLTELLNAGELPNIQRVFVEGGVGVEQGFDCLPSVTYANFSSFITGRFPGHHGITGNLWLDRNTLENHYYMTLATYRDVNKHIKAPTVYEMLADHFTANIQCHTRRGATVTLDNSARFKWDWILGTYLDADRHVPNSLPKLVSIANRVKRWPSLIVTYYPGVDEIGHRYGTDSPQYAEALRNVDVIVGRITRAVADAGLAERTTFILVSDHGMVPVGKNHHFDLKRWLHEARGLRVIDQPLLWARKYPYRLVALNGYDVFLVIGADRRAQIHLKGRRGWVYPPTPAEIEAFVKAGPPLHEQPAVDCVLMRAGPDRVRVLARTGEALIERRRRADGVTQYRLRVQSGDPLGYLRCPRLAAFIEKGWHGSRQWLEATARTDHPDFVPQAAELFDSARTGDLLVFAADDWDFNRGLKAGHGSCLYRDMHIPLFFAGPDLPAGATIPVARLVDVAPTILGLLNEADRLEKFPPIDGIDLSPQLRSAGAHLAAPSSSPR